MRTKELVLGKLKAQWKAVAELQYKTDPEITRRANIEKNADAMMTNPLVKRAAKAVGITVKDIQKILTEIRDEIISANEKDKKRMCSSR